MELKDCYKDYLDGMTHEERSIFLYGVVLKLPVSEISKRLKLPNRQVKELLNALEFEVHLIRVKAYIYESLRVNLF